jgi:ribose 1,5-bisphosphokinase PhnN
VVTGEVDVLAASLAKADRERLSDLLARLLDQVPDR